MNLKIFKCYIFFCRTMGLIPHGKDLKDLKYTTYGSVRIMGGVKWIKIDTSMFEDERIKLIDAMVDKDIIHYVWIRLLLQAGKTNADGLIYLSEDMPYSNEMLSTIFNRPLDTINYAIKVLSSLGMIEIDEKNVIKIVNWDKHQNVEGMERVRELGKKRSERFRTKKKKVQDDNENDGISDENIIDNLGNVTKNENNVTVTEQIESEKENKNEIKNEKESDTPIAENMKDNKQPNSDFINNSFNEDNNICDEAVSLLKYYESITGRINGLNIGTLKLAIEQHGSINVKKAVTRAIEVNKCDMKYINGILKNWRIEGYPKEEEVKNSGRKFSYKSSGRTDKNEFAGFKPKKPRTLTEEERRKVEETLI